MAIPLAQLTASGSTPVSRPAKSALNLIKKEQEVVAIAERSYSPKKTLRGRIDTTLSLYRLQ